MTTDDLAPEDRIQAQDQIVKIWLSRRCPQGTRRKGDHPGVPIQKFDVTGQPVRETWHRPPESSGVTSRQRWGQARAADRKKKHA